MPATIITVPSPVGGWNQRDAFDNMPPTDAVVLRNFFPGTTTIALRGGHALHCDTGETDPVGTLMEYGAGAGSTLLAATAGKIFDVSTSTPSSLATGYGSDVWSYTNMATAGGQFLIAANDTGADMPWVFDGATVTPVVVTGVTGTDLSLVCTYQNRVFYGERNSTSVWYSAAGAFQGALTEFDFGGFLTKGGKISALASWTRDNGFGGVDDLFVVVTSKGEVLIYAGDNPSSSATWSMQGRFVLGEPVSGPHSVFRFGPDLVLICADGFQPLSDYLTTGETRAQETNLAFKIGSAASDAVRLYRGNAYWGAIIYPEGTQLIVNVPTSATSSVQYVANTTTGAWCEYTGMAAASWSRFDGGAYFGGFDGVVYQFDEVRGDNGSDVVGEVITAFNPWGARGRQKRAMLLRPVLRTDAQVQFSVGVNVDYELGASLPVVSSNIPSGGLWDAGLWDVALWSGDTMAVQKRWTNAAGIGYVHAIQFKVSTQTTRVELAGFDVSFEAGGPL